MTLAQAVGDHADDPRMPRRIVEHDAWSSVVSRLAESGFGFTENTSLFLPPVHVGLLELGRQRGSFVGICGEQEVERLTWICDAANRIDPRAENKADLMARYGSTPAKPRLSHEGAQPCAAVASLARSCPPSTR